MGGKRFIYKWLLGSLLSFLFAYAICAIGGVLLQKLAGEPYGYLKYYYDFVNYLPKDGGGALPEKDIILIDTHDSSLGSRLGIARLLDSLGRFEVKAVGLDAIFQLTHEFTDEGDESLQQAIAHFPHPLVVACRRRGPDSLEHSFFIPTSKVDFGTTNAQSFYGFVPRDSMSNQTVEKMVVGLARKAGYLIPEELIVNYSNRGFQCVSSWDDIDASLVKGKIVLIGDDRDARDSFDLPFRIEGKFSMSGMRINAYQLASLIHPESSFRVVSSTASALASIGLILLYGLFISWWINLLRKDMGKWPKIGLYLLEPVSVLLIEFLAVLALIWIIKQWFRIPNLLLFMAAVPLAGTCHKIAAEYFGQESDKLDSK